MAWIASLWASSSFWEGVEYSAEGVVVICALLEILADFEHILKGDENRALRKSVEKWAAIGLVLGLALGLVALVRTNRLFTEEITSLYREARDASNRATDASGKAKAAFDRAASADDRATDAQHLADKAGTDLASARKQLQYGQIKLAQEQQKAFKAQADAIDLQRKVNGSFLHRLLDRHVDIRLREFLKTLPSAQAEVRTIDSDTEAVVFAYEIRAALLESGWTIPPVVPIKKTPELTGVTIADRDIAAFFPFTGELPLPVVSGMLGTDGKSVDIRLATLVSALQVRVLTKDPTLPETFFRITVGENVLPNGFSLPPK